MKLTFRIWVLIASLLIAALLIGFSFDKGVVIKSIERNSTYYENGLRPGMIITAINSNPIQNIEEYSSAISSIVFSSNDTKVTITTKQEELVFFANKLPQITVSNIPKTRIKTGLDLSGGARALIKPEIEISSSQMDDLISITSNRFNTFGLSDITIKKVSDLSGNNFMLIEVAGATPADLEDLVSKQGKFEAKIGNETVFIGGEEDVTYVARTGEQSGIYSCNTYQEGDFCRFRFTITLSEKAAKKQADATSSLLVNSSNPEYLEKSLDLYVDDELVDTLLISKDLKGKVATDIMIQGSGSGSSRQEAYDDAVNNMKKLQTILITGSLPYKLEIVKLDTISPSLGKEFTKNIIYLALIVFAAVSIVLFLKYRKIKITSSVILTMFSEAFITLGIAALIKWNLDISSIAGIIAGMGTGVNDQIVIIDEAVSDKSRSLKERIKSALFIILGAFFTIIAAMLPLFWAGAGMLKGFALTTIIGVSVGILITRPAFADIIKQIQKD
ncbi:MAG: hypothetical protein ACP5OG_01615 [Candidatus Nanoarchaeia archaeon]